jgi:hypothetical protein
MLTEEKKKEMLRMARGLLPNGYAIVPLDPTPGMLEQAAFNLCESYGHDRVKELGKFARDSYAEMVNAGMAR